MCRRMSKTHLDACICDTQFPQKSLSSIQHMILLHHQSFVMRTGCTAAQTSVCITQDMSAQQLSNTYCRICTVWPVWSRLLCLESTRQLSHASIYSHALYGPWALFAPVLLLLCVPNFLLYIFACVVGHQETGFCIMCIHT